MEQDVVTEMEAIEVSDEKEETVEGCRPERGALRQADDDDMAAGEKKRRRVTGKQHERRSSLESETSKAALKRQKRAETLAVVKEEAFKTVPDERPAPEQAHNFYASSRTARNKEWIHAEGRWCR